MEYILFFLRNGVERAETELADFKTRLEKDPHDAFSWAEKAMKAASRRLFFSRYIKMIETADSDATQRDS